MYKYLTAIILTTVIAIRSNAQSQQPDTLKPNPAPKFLLPKAGDNKVYHPDSLHSPHKAVIRSLIIPGWGQLYNRQWYYVPVIYAGLGLLVDGIIFNQNNYKPTLAVAHYYEQGRTINPGSANYLPPSAPDYKLWLLYQQNNVSQQNLDDQVEGYRRDRDLCILGFMGAWGVQVIQAYIQAKFKHSYTMDTNLSFKISPVILNQQALYATNFAGPVIPGLKLTIML